MMDLASQFDISISGLVSGFIFGVVGWYLFRDGRKRANYHVLVIGILLMVYPYFTHGPWQDWGVGFALCGLAYHFWDQI